jgi:hypothetical protein
MKCCYYFTITMAKSLREIEFTKSQIQLIYHRFQILSYFYIFLDFRFIQEIFKHFLLNITDHYKIQIILLLLL